jgi:DNA-binding LacI/PurR family transcriptional regulator
MSRVTLKDVAEACGLSRAAVSLVVQDSPRVSEQTKTRVRKVMAEMGYVYDRGAANLRTRRSMIVGLIVTNVRNPYFAMTSVAARTGSSPPWSSTAPTASSSCRLPIAPPDRCRC